jgi:hypothetical protein
MPMSEYEQDPSASTGRFQAFVERGDEDRARRNRVSPALLIVAGVLVIAVIAVIIVIAAIA